MTKYCEEVVSREPDDGAHLLDLEEEYESLNRHPARDEVRERWCYIQIPTEVDRLFPNMGRESPLPDYPVCVGKDIYAYDSSGKTSVRLVEHSKCNAKLVRVEYANGKRLWARISSLVSIGSDAPKKEFKE